MVPLAQLAPLGYDLFHRVRNLEKELRSSRDGEERAKAELHTALEDRKKLEAKLQEQGQLLAKKEEERVAAVAELTSLQKFSSEKLTQIRIMDQKLGEFLVERRTMVAGFVESLRVAKEAAIGEYKASGLYKEDIAQYSAESFVEGFEACKYQVGVVSPSFPLARLDVCSENPKTAEEVESASPVVEETPAKETSAPGAADGETSEGASAEKASVETSAPVAAEVVVSEVPASDTEAEAEELALKRKASSVTADPVAAGADVVGNAEPSEGSPAMVVLE